MIQALIWWLEVSPRWFSCLTAHGRSQQEVLRAALFHSGRVLASPAPASDKLSRLARRATADTITLLHDNGQVQLQLGREPLPPLLADCACYRSGQHLQQHGGQLCLQGLVDLGRALLR